MIFSSVLYAENNTTVQTCELVSSQSFGYTGDTSGKRVYTKEKFFYNCISVSKEKGSCKKNVLQHEDINIGKLKGGPVYYETKDYSGTMGDMLAVVQAYDKINGLWEGYHGFCQKGMDDNNFAWASDPYVLAGYALDAITAGYGVEASSAADAANTAGEASSASSTLSQVAAEKAAEKAAASYAKYEIVHMGACIAHAGLDVGKMLTDFYKDGPPCDPVDEICGKEKNAASDQGNVMTISTKQYNDMLTENPGYKDYIEIVDGRGTSMLTVKVISPPEQNSQKVDMKKTEALRKKAKKIKLVVSAAITTLATAACVFSGGSSGGTTSGKSKEGSPTSVNSILTTLLQISLSAANPLLGMAFSIGENVYGSLQPINTCDNKNDAKAKGSRHLATNNALHNGMCHLVGVVKTGTSASLNKREKYTYCCYNDKITRILVEQSKAQLAKSWKHCTDISPNELTHLSFKSCDPVELDAGVDGVKLDAYVSEEERYTAYQATHNCIDTREYMSYMISKFGGSPLLDKKTLTDLLGDFK